MLAITVKLERATDRATVARLADEWLALPVIFVESAVAIFACGVTRAQPDVHARLAAVPDGRVLTAPDMAPCVHQVVACVGVGGRRFKPHRARARFCIGCI